MTNRTEIKKRHIYTLSAEGSDAPVYVGQTSRPKHRLWQHRTQSTLGIGVAIEMHIISEGYWDWNTALKMEAEHVDRLLAEGHTLINRTQKQISEAASKALTGREFSEETKAKISKAHTGKKLDEEHRATMSEAQQRRYERERAEGIRPPKKQRKLKTPEEKSANYRAAALRRSPETKAKIAEALKGKKREGEALENIRKAGAERSASGEASASAKRAWETRRAN